MGFFGQEYWSGLPFPSPGALPDPGLETGSPAFQAGALTSEPPGKQSCLEWVAFPFSNPSSLGVFKSMGVEFCQMIFLDQLM